VFVGEVSGVDLGRPLDRASRQRLFNLGNMLWHSDSSFRPIPAKYSLLSARVVNPIGGNTEFADMRAAYDELEAGTKALIADLVCEHSLMYSRARSACSTTRTRSGRCSGRCASGSCAPIP
jgi:alpha-ketoglutarate-dependent taurine dioxygenase